MHVSTSQFVKLLQHGSSAVIKRYTTKSFLAAALIHQARTFLCRISNDERLRHDDIKANVDLGLVNDKTKSTGTKTNVTLHLPVLVDEVVDVINPQDGQVMLAYTRIFLSLTYNHVANLYKVLFKNLYYHFSIYPFTLSSSLKINKTQTEVYFYYSFVLLSCLHVMAFIKNVVF